MEIELGRGKRARRAYTFDDIAVVPSRRTRNPEDVSTAWSIDAFGFDIPILSAPMDSVVSPQTAIMLGKLGGLGVLDLEGLWTRYEDPEPLLAEIASLPDGAATGRMQQLYAEADQARARHPAPRGDPRRRRHRRGRAHAAADAGPVRDRGRGGCRPLRHPRHDRVGRARVVGRRAAEPQEVHLRPRRAGHRRRRLHVHRRPAPHAHRCRRRARRLRRGSGVDDARDPRHPRPDGDRGRRRRRRSPRLPRRVRRPLRARHRRRRGRHLGRHGEGPRDGGGCRDARRRARPRDGRPRRRATTGVRRRTTRSCPAAAG